MSQLELVTSESIEAVAKREGLDLYNLHVTFEQYEGFVSRGQREYEIDQVIGLFRAHHPDAIHITDFVCYLQGVDSLATKYVARGKVVEPKKAGIGTEH